MQRYPSSQSIKDVEKLIFNYHRLCRGSRLVECAFGILSEICRTYFAEDLELNPKMSPQLF